MTKAEICIEWRQQRRQAGSNNELAAQIRLGSIVAGIDDVDLVNEYIDYATEEC